TKQTTAIAPKNTATAPSKNIDRTGEQGRLKAVIYLPDRSKKPMQRENWVDYKEVKSAATMEMVLDRYGVAVRRVNKTYLRGKCPLPTHNSDTSKESFGVSTEK